MFSWLLYDSPEAREQWPRYLAELRALGVSDERLRAQLRCRLIPARVSVRRIDWRLSLFGEQIALCSYDPDHSVGAAGAQTFTLDSPAALHTNLTALFAICPTIEAHDAALPDVELDRIRAAHVGLKSAFLRSFQQGLPTDIMLHRLEDAAESSNTMMEQTRLLIWISVLTLIVVVATLALTQFRFP